MSLEQATKFLPSLEKEMWITEKLKMSVIQTLSYLDGFLHKRAFVHMYGDRLQELAGDAVIHPLVLGHP